MRRWLPIVGGLLLAQGIMVAVWLASERDPAASAAAPAPFTVVAIDRPLPSLKLSDLEGQPIEVPTGSPYLLHFWATWCPPCRAELPKLWRYAGQTSMTVLAASTDTEPSLVRQFLPGGAGAQVVLVAGKTVRDAFEVQTLPVTFVVGPEGRLRRRVDGPVDWSSPAQRALALGGFTSEL